MAMYRGLSTFISDIRNCKTKEQEQQRVDKELANVRKAFTSGKMTPYDRKKYVWKLVYVNMLGYDVDFGHMEMISLLSCPSYSEKLVGYLSTSVMLRNTDEQITLVVQAIKSDLASTQDPVQCLALSAIANIGGKELAEAVAPDVTRILFSRSIFPVVRKKAALCLLRLVRISRDLMPAEEWAKKLIGLLEDKNLGVVLSVVTLLHGLAEKDPAAYEGATGHLLVWLTRLAVAKQVAPDYVYHSAACPWLQVKILRLLALFPIPATEAMRVRLNEILTHILNRTEVTKSVNRNNAEHCVLFEAVNLIIKQGELSLPELRGKAVAHLSKFINIREPNIRYLGLETMARLVALEGTGDAIRRQQATIMFSLKDADISIRRRALDLLFAMCTREIAPAVVKELLSYLALAEWSIKDEMVLKMAILAERFAPDLRWYVDTIIQLIAIAGDFVSDDIWHRVVQIVTNNEPLQRYAAAQMYRALEPASAHETAVKVGGYILGEFGFLLADGDGEGGAAISGVAQFAALHQHFAKCSPGTKALLLSTYAKLSNLYPELRGSTGPIFGAHASAMDAELQQRAIEYAHLPGLKEEVLSLVLDAMPAFPERDSALETKLKKQTEEVAEKDQWAAEGDGGAKKEEVVDDDEDSGAGAGAGAGARARAASGGLAAPPAPSSSAAGGAATADLLGDLLGTGAPAPAPAPAPAAVDPLSVPVTQRVTIEAAAGGAAQVGRWFSALLTKPGGILYEDATVQIGVKSKWGPAAEGKLSIFVGNKTSTPLLAFKARVPPVPAVKVEVGEVPASIAPKAQVQLALSLECLQPFVDAPALQISFISTPGTGHAYALRVPVAASSFCEPVAMPGADFKARWGALAGAPREVTAVITPASGAGAVSMAAASRALELVGMAAIDAGAPGATGAASFRTHTMGGNGQHISVGCLAMAIPDAATGVFKVAVRTQHADVSKALMAVLQPYLQAL